MVVTEPRIAVDLRLLAKLRGKLGEEAHVLEDGFKDACVEAIDECAAFGYDPTAWKAMINRHGAAEAARRLVVSGSFQDGFKRLLREGRLDLTVEFAILNPKWGRLFDSSHREAAWWRLERAMRDQSSVTELT